MPTSTAQGTSQVCTLNPDYTNRRWLGALGHINGLNWDFVYPGGCNQMSLTLARPPQWRNSAIYSGRIAEVWRGGSRIWEGILDMSVPDTSGWSVSAHGAGTYGGQFMAHYTAWNIDNPIDSAITRGLRWRKPTFGGSVGFLETQPEDASITITDHLNNATIQAGLLWNIDTRQQNLLGIAAPPTVVDRLLVCTVPAPRTLAAGLNTLWYTYVSAVNGNTDTDTTTSTSSPQGILQHGNMEQQVDFTAAGLMTSGTASGNANAIMNQYIRANFSNAFSLRRGQWLTLGGQPIDLGSETAYPHVARLLLTDGSYGAEVVPTPVSFVVAGWAFDQDSETAQCTAYQTYKSDLSTLLTAVVPKLRQ